MKYALVNGERQEAQPKLTGKCELHGCPVIAKCGNERVWHWSHQDNRMCDPWWENQTDWHRAWKDLFPKEWQEVTHTAANGDKHRADVKTNQGYVIEFQYSHLDPQERIEREAFYQNMIWVVSGTRLKGDYPRFLEKGKHFRPIAIYRPDFFLVPSPEACFPTAWVKSAVEVVFDFQSTPPTDPQDGMRNILWCLLPGRTKRGAIMIAIPRQTFITTLLKQPRLLRDPAHEYVDALDELLTDQEEMTKRLSQQQDWRPSGKRSWRL